MSHPPLTAAFCRRNGSQHASWLSYQEYRRLEAMAQSRDWSSRRRQTCRPRRWYWAWGTSRRWGAAWCGRWRWNVWRWGWFKWGGTNWKAFMSLKEMPACLFVGLDLLQWLQSLSFDGQDAEVCSSILISAWIRKTHLDYRQWMKPHQKHLCRWGPAMLIFSEFLSWPVKKGGR